MNANSKQKKNGAVELPLEKVLHEQIEKRAYDIWVARGGGHGEHMHHWLQAESEVLKTFETTREQRSSARRIS